MRDSDVNTAGRNHCLIALTITHKPIGSLFTKERKAQICHFGNYRNTSVLLHVSASRAYLLIKHAC